MAVERYSLSPVMKLFLILTLLAVKTCFSYRVADEKRFFGVNDKPFNIQWYVRNSDYFKSGTSYYKSHMAVFNLIKISLVGIRPNPGPSPTGTSPNKMIDGLRAWYINSRGLKAFVDDHASGKKINKLSLFQNLIYTEQYDIVRVCETWLKENVLDNEILPGYTIHRTDLCDYKRGGGVLVAVKDEKLPRRNKSRIYHG